MRQYFIPSILFFKKFDEFFLAQYGMGVELRITSAYLIWPASSSSSSSLFGLLCGVGWFGGDNA